MAFKFKAFIAYNTLILIFLIYEWSPEIFGLIPEHDNAAGYVVGIFLFKIITVLYFIGVPISYYLGNKIRELSEIKNT